MLLTFTKILGGLDHQSPAQNRGAVKVTGASPVSNDS